LPRAPEFWQHDGALARLLAPFGALYGAATRLREARAHPFRPRARVLCVGNLTAGGAGKTPVVLALAQLLIARGARIAFLTRGYGGDEDKLLAAVARTIVTGDRTEGARIADAEGADIIIMDDGHQNFALSKDLSLVVVDAETGFGNRRLIPAGPLRESTRRGLARAHAVILMGGGTPQLEGFSGPVLRAHLQAKSEMFRGKPVFAFAGIGRPEKFFRTLRETGAELRSSRAFPDHHAYSARELDGMRKEAARLGGMLVTTEKDYARLSESQRSFIACLAVEARFDEPAALEALLDIVWPKRPQPRR
jgi:tetraacyldisaccharide 4'-kinase